VNLELRRMEYGDNYTVGKLFVDGEYECFTLEDKVREVPGQAVDQWKVKGATAIPEGTYKVTYEYSPHFKTNRPRLHDVPGFEGVLIHTGNSDKDTEGCILVGEHWAGTNWIANSTRAYVSLEPKITQALNAGDTVTITIKG
jgi:hypothetical protein